MIVCHCMNISDRDIDNAVNWMRASDPEAIITPGKVYRVLGKSADCGGCMPLFLATMRDNANLVVPMNLRGDTGRGARQQDDRTCKATVKSSNT